MSTIEGEQTGTSRVAAGHESREPTDPSTESTQTSSELRQSKWTLGHLTGIPAHLIGVVWIYFSSFALIDGFRYWDDDTLWQVFHNGVPGFNFLAALLLLVLQVLWAYKIMILASNEHWQRPVRVRVPFIGGVMIVLYVLLVAGLIFSACVAVLWLCTEDSWTWPEVLLGCVLAVIGGMHYAIILVGKLSRGRTALYFVFERRVSKSNRPSETAPVVAPYRDDEEAGAQGPGAQGSSEGALIT